MTKQKKEHMERYLYQQQKSNRKTTDQQNQTLKNHRKSVAEKIVSWEGFKQKRFFHI